MSVAAGGAVALAAALDRTLAEPPAEIHPVVWIGRCIGRIDDFFPDTRPFGVSIALILPTVFAILAGALVLGTTMIGPIYGSVVAGALLFCCTSVRMLVDVAGDVVDRSKSDLDEARTELAALAGREASPLSAAEVRSAAVESAAENLSDGVVAPLFGFAMVLIVVSVLEGTLAVTGASPAGWPGSVWNITDAVARLLPVHGGLAVATAAAVWIKVVNTSDSMLGYRDRRIGWGPARLDDAVMWVPARITALLLACIHSPTRVVGTLRRARTVAREPDSPNSGWPMATIAEVLGVRLEKPNAYELFPDLDLPSVRDANDGIGLVSRAGWTAYGLTVLVAVITI